jgi:pimeloyl-ACP methyl ester carboxylesterase
MALAEQQVRVRLTSVGGALVRSVLVPAALGVASPPEGDRGHGDGTAPLVVVLPGLGLPYYTRPTAMAVSARGLDCEVLDLPGFGSPHPRSTPPDINAIGLAAAGWVRARAAGRPVVIAGHSTAAQAALTAALALGPLRRAYSLLMAGPTFTPSQRRFPRLAARTPFAYREDRPEQLHAAEVARGRGGIVAILRSGMRDAPDERIVGLQSPVTLTSGVHDAFAPADWLDTLARAATSSAGTRTSQVGGSHNNLFTHPDALADLLVLAAADAVAWQ